MDQGIARSGYGGGVARSTAAMISAGSGNRPAIFSATFTPSTQTVNSPEFPISICAGRPSTFWICATARVAWGL